MGKRGPRKTPTALARLRGFPGKQRQRQEPEPSTPSADHPVHPPTWLDARARAEWRRLAPELSRLGLLTVLDLTKFAAYCCWCSTWRDYQQRLAARRRHRQAGDLLTTRSGAVKPHPLIAMAKQAAEMMNRFGSQFGLSPSDRTSVSLPLDPTAPAHDRPHHPPPQKPRDEFDEFLRKNRGTHATTS